MPPARPGCLRYAILDPTGNITALVEDPVAIELQPRVAAQVMAAHPEVEQVGFLRPGRTRAHGNTIISTVDVELRMAGGEFCGNASLSAAALYLLRSSEGAHPTSERAVRLRVSGCELPVNVRMRRSGPASFEGRVRMPRPSSIGRVELRFGELRALLPLVRMPGISHIVVDEDSPFMSLVQRAADAEHAVRRWCAELACEGLGIMFLRRSGTDLRCTPLVYVPGADTVFWESSCASGSSAVGMWMGAERGSAVAAELIEPGGTLSVSSAPGADTWLRGQVRLVGEHLIEPVRAALG